MKRENRLQKRTFVSTMILAFLMLFLACSEDPEIDPVLNTIQVADANFTSTTAKLSGEITILGTKNIIEYGIELSKSQLFTSPLRKFYTTPAVLGTFEVEFTGLDPNTMYYYKAYVVVNTAHVYSPNPLHFTTKP
jgi:hypothetical protein